MKNKILGIVFIMISFLQGCKSKYDPSNFLTTDEKEKVTASFLPYVLPRPDGLPLADRFKDSMKVYYEAQKKPNELQLYSYYIQKDSSHYVMFVRRDLKSLYVDYRAIAATFNRSKDSIYNIELKFLTPMFRRDTIYRKADELFSVLVDSGQVKNYIGNRDFIDWPSNDVYYDKQERKWALKKNSEWGNVMEEAKKDE